MAPRLSGQNCNFFKFLLSLNSQKRLGVLSIMPKIPEISVGIQMERSVSVSSDRNIRDHLWRWSTYFVVIFRSKFAVLFFTNRFFALIREFGNDKKWQELFLLVGAVSTENVVPFSLGSPTYL